MPKQRESKSLPSRRKKPRELTTQEARIALFLGRLPESRMVGDAVIVKQENAWKK